ncbi:MAG: hypothetical protein RR854_01520 [Muribaculaceae bacterium]
MDKLTSVLWLTILILLFGSCEDDDCCQPRNKNQYTVQLFIKDKNYFNIDKIDLLAKNGENSPFQQYVNNIYYELREFDSGKVLYKSDIIPITHKELSHNISFNKIPNGKYELTVWGNVTTDVPIGYLHFNNNEHTDIYMANTTLIFSSECQTAKLFLERTKGMLAVSVLNYPAGITTVKQSLSSISELVNHHFEYSGNTLVYKDFAIQPMLQTVLSPIIGDKKAILSLQFSDGKNSNIHLPEIPIPIKRNEISIVRVDFDALTIKCKICILIDKEWTIVDELYLQ